MKMTAEDRAILDRYPQLLTGLCREPAWKSGPDDYGHAHCFVCGSTIHVGDPCLASYSKYTSTVFCPTSADDNSRALRRWLKPKG